MRLVWLGSELPVLGNLAETGAVLAGQAGLAGEEHEDPVDQSGDGRQRVLQVARARADRLPG